jgi:hypothetical protein
MGGFGQKEPQKRQTHADEHDLAVGVSRAAAQTINWAGV